MYINSEVLKRSVGASCYIVCSNCFRLNKSFL